MGDCRTRALRSFPSRSKAQFACRARLASRLVYFFAPIKKCIRCRRRDRFMVLAEICNYARFSLCLGGTIMALSGKTKRGITLAIAVIAGLASVLLAVLLLVLAVLLIAWGQAPERTEAFVGRLPYGNYLLKELAKLDLTLSDRS
jgi:O-antigen ligase